MDLARGCQIPGSGEVPSPTCRRVRRRKSAISHGNGSRRIPRPLDPCLRSPDPRQRHSLPPGPTPRGGLAAAQLGA
eukprot:3980349-Pyramimonas_sp.AAC.1